MGVRMGFQTYIVCVLFVQGLLQVLFKRSMRSLFLLSLEILEQKQHIENKLFDGMGMGRLYLGEYLGPWVVCFCFSFLAPRNIMHTPEGSLNRCLKR